MSDEVLLFIDDLKKHLNREYEKANRRADQLQDKIDGADGTGWMRNMCDLKEEMGRMRQITDTLKYLRESIPRKPSQLRTQECKNSQPPA